MLYYPLDMIIPGIIYHIASVIRGQCTSLLYRVVSFRQRHHALPSTRHENSGDRIPHRKWDSWTVYVSSSSSCGFSTEALCYYPSDMRIPVSYILPYLHGQRFTDRTMSSISCLLSCGKDIYPPSDMRIPVSYIAISTRSAIHRPNNEQHFLFIELWERHLSSSSYILVP